MKTRTLFIAWTITAMLSVFASNQLENPFSAANEEIIASFDSDGAANQEGQS